MSESLSEIAKYLVQSGKGLLAADESLSTAKKRLESVGVEDSSENRRLYRELFLTTLDIEKYLSGVIFFDETFRQKTSDGVSFVKLLADKGIYPGIKVDQGKEPLVDSPEESLTVGFDGLERRLAEYASIGAKFTKWRCVVDIGDGLPTEEAIRINAEGLVKYARTVQAAELVPIIEPEVMLAGNHSMSRAEEVTNQTLKIVFECLERSDVLFEGLILKSSMVVPGSESGEEMNAERVAEATVRVFKETVPAEIGGIVFLSGGQTPEQATANLNAISKLKAEMIKTKDALPWPLTFSYARALQGPALKHWRGDSSNWDEAQEIFRKRLELTSLARQGKLAFDNIED